MLTPVEVLNEDMCSLFKKKKKKIEGKKKWFIKRWTVKATCLLTFKNTSCFGSYTNNVNIFM